MSRSLPALDQGSRLLLDKASEGVAIVQDGMIKSVNPSLLKLTSYSELELTSRPFIDFVHPDDRQMVAERHFMRLMGKEVPSAYAFRILDKQGDCRWVELNAVSVLWEGALAVLCFLMDVTERRRADEELNQSEEKYRHLFENTQDGVEVIDGETGRVVLANQAAARMFGFASADEMVGIDPLEYIPSEDRERVAGMMLEYMFEKDLHKLAELKVHTKDGRLVWVSGVGAKTEYQGRLAGLVSMRDVTEQKQTEKALCESERHYRLLADNISDVIWVTDMNLKPTYVSSSISRLTGYTIAEAMSLTIADILTTSSLEMTQEAFLGALASQRNGGSSSPPPLAVEVVRKDGSTVWAESTLSFVYDAAGQPVEILGVLRDISERRTMEGTLRESLNQLERTMEGTIRAMSLIVETRDSFTAGHQRRTSELSHAIAQEMNLPAEQVKVVRIAALLHDIGKIGVPTEVLSKPGRLSEIESALIKTHSQAGYDILKTVDFPWPIADIVRQHHERLDGSGYPLGLRNENILLEARILGVADVVEAMTSHRPYRPAPGIDKALEEIDRNGGRLYDAVVVSACLHLFKKKGFSFENPAPLPEWFPV